MNYKRKRTIYRVELEHTYSGLSFDFADYQQACDFMASALESMNYGDGGKRTCKLTIIDEEVGLNE